MRCLRCLRNFACAAVLFSISCWSAQAQMSLPKMNATHSVSGQFIVTGGQPSRLMNVPAVTTNTDLVRLKPALLAVSAERIKQTLYRDLDINPNARWRGKIFLALHPAQSLNDGVTVTSEHFADGWDYRVALPDIVPRTRFARAMTGVILQEFANRSAGARSAEIPPWLKEGLSQLLLATGSVEIVLSSPAKTMNGVLESRTDFKQRGFDPLARARSVLRDHKPLTFEQLSWPTDAQLSGDDGGIYRASAQLFVSELLKLKQGPARLRTMLQISPRYYNWQTAFQEAFHTNFARPLDVEKWWALQVVDFMAHDPGPTWTPAVSRDKLNQILDVPVDFRTTSNALPTHATISLQAVIRNFDTARQTTILESKLYDLELAQFRMARPLAALTAGYRQAIADYLGENRKFHWPWDKRIRPRKRTAGETVQKLDALDAQRRTIESSIKPDVLKP